LKHVIFGLLVALALTSSVSSVAQAQASPIKPPWRFQLPWATAHSRIVVGGIPLEVEVADTNLLRGRGLSYRDGLAPGTGMVFVYNEPQPLTFWMYEMRFCLDIIWISNSEIRGAAENACPEPGVPADQLKIYESPEPVQYVLEVPAGWMKEHGFDVGTPVQIDSSLRDKDDSS